jgi:hypothetical protein
MKLPKNGKSNKKDPYRQMAGRDKVIISSEQYEAPEITTFICNYCNRDLIKLSESSGNNVSWYCNNCSIPFEPENESIRHKQKLEVPDRNIEPAIATTPGIPDISIRHEPELKDGALALSKKGTIRFTQYKDSSQ